ncbi:MAG: DUF4340 domain-containing protein [Alphaproteobacteria bacterium]|nr:DUF4340 domain-containing protein [Alphaproteobacteria bacterium]
MKAFRGTLIVGLLLLLVIGLVVFVEKPPEDPKKPQDLERPLFTFEKQDLVRVHVRRADGTEVALKETDDGWLIEGTDFPASRTMVNRVKHQLHDLTARAEVIQDADDPALYGLGAQAIEVSLFFRDGSERRFRAGDPNPSSVSYYIQPTPGETIYTVKKSAVDYYSLELDEFRERRFASFDSKDADGIEADLPDGQRLHLQRSGDDAWEMLEPVEMSVARDKARALLGRIAVLKAREFVIDFPEDQDMDLAPYGLDAPRARITVRFGSRDPLTLRLGAAIPHDDTDDEPRAYMMVEGDRTVYIAKDAFLEDFLEDPASMRLRRFMRIAGLDVVEIDAALHRPPEPGDDLLGDVKLRMIGDVWQWDDGLPVPGSTPRRLAMRIGGVEAEEFIDDSPANLGVYGLDLPLATLTATDDTGTTRTLLIGDLGPSRMGPEDRTITRRYAMVEGEPSVYLVEHGVVEVLEDALREHGRKARKDDEKEERLRAMEEARQAPLPEGGGI